MTPVRARIVQRDTRVALMRVARVSVALVFVAISPERAHTQGNVHNSEQNEASARRPSLVIAGPSAFGLVVPITPRLRLRPDFSVSRSTFNVGSSESKFVNTSLGLSLLVALNKDLRLVTYAAPRIALSRNTYDDGSIADLWIFDTMYGAHATITPRFGLFSEVGPRVTYTDQSTPGAINRTTAATIRSSLGATLRF